MSQKKQSSLISAMIIIAFLLLVIDIIFNSRGSIFPLLVSGVLIYYGRLKYQRTSGKVYFWVGCFILFFTIVNLLAFRFLILAIIAYFIWKYFISKNSPARITVKTAVHSNLHEDIYIKKPWLFKNRLFGGERTPDHAYEWEDIHIQSGVGDAVIDLSYTVLPKGESVISIQKMVGNITILIPYDLELSIHHSAVMGAVSVFQHDEPKIFNHTIIFQTANFANADQRIKVITSTVLGDLEVKRV